MLKVECSKCNQWVQLPFVTREKEARCSNCSNVIPIKDVYVSAGPFMIYRDILLKNMFKYKKLINEAEKEIDEIRKSGGGQKSYDLSVDSIREFVGNMKEMLSGCRDNVRHLIDDYHAEYTINGATFTGRVDNISTTGVGLDMEKNAGLAKLWSQVDVSFTYKGERYDTRGKVMWVGKKSLVGIKFEDLDERCEKFLQDLIMERSLMLKKK